MGWKPMPPQMQIIGQSLILLGGEAAQEIRQIRDAGDYWAVGLGAVGGIGDPDGRDSRVLRAVDIVMQTVAHEQRVERPHAGLVER